MGMYIFITEEDRKTMRTVKDIEVNDLFQEALMHDSSLMISEELRIEKMWLGKRKGTTHFNVYHESPAFDGSAYQASYQITGSGSKNIATAYLYGIINGSLARQSKPTNQ